MPDFIGLRELAKLLGVSPATVTYYTNLGLFKVEKVSGNKKLYNRSAVVKHHENIQKLRRDGYTLGLIKRKFEENKEGE